MSRRHIENSPTIYELGCVAAIKQAGGEFVDIETIRTRMSRVGLCAEKTTLYSVVKRLEDKRLLFRTDQKHRPHGEPFVFYSLTEEGCTWLTKWTNQLKDLL